MGEIIGVIMIVFIAVFIFLPILASIIKELFILFYLPVIKKIYFMTPFGKEYLRLMEVKRRAQWRAKCYEYKKYCQRTWGNPR